MDNSEHAATPLTEINRVVHEMSVVLNETMMKVQELDRNNRMIYTHSSSAWNEREQLQSDYQGLRRGFLSIVDACESGAENDILQRLLTDICREQRIEAIAAHQGDRFDAALHVCEETVAAPAGAIVRIVEKGYVQRHRDGTAVVVRPARVVVGKGEANGA